MGAKFRLAGSDTFTAVVATLGVEDADGDILAPGSVGAVDVPVIAPGSADQVPIGKAHLTERLGELVAIGRLNLGTRLGREWHSAIKHDLATGSSLQEWSLAYMDVQAVNDRVDGRRVRVIKHLRPVSISPVLRSSSVGTRTVDAKAADLIAAQDAVIREGMRLLAGKRREPESFRYVYLRPRDHREKLASAYWLSELAAEPLGIAAPVPRIFRPAKADERGDLTLDEDILGLAHFQETLTVFDEDRPVIMLKDVPLGSMAATIGHEVRHQWQHQSGWDMKSQRCEDDAEEYGQKFAAWLGMGPQSDLYADTEPQRIVVSPDQFAKGVFWLDPQRRHLYAAAGHYYAPRWIFYRDLS